MSTLILVSLIIGIATLSFVYAIGCLHGSQKERTKQNERELEIVKDAVKIRINADPNELRKKYKCKG